MGGGAVGTPRVATAEVVTARIESGPTGGGVGGVPQFGSGPVGPPRPTKSRSSTTDVPPTVAVAITSRTSFAVIAHGSGAVPGSGPSVTSRHVGCDASLPLSRAFIAALTIRPASPAPIPTALEEQLVEGIARVIFALKFVQPLKSRYDWSGAGIGDGVTELTRMVCGR